MANLIKVLYVDDESVLLDIGKLFLEQEGNFSVDTRTSASDALASLTSTEYDAIISDYQMPEMDGIVFLKKVRASGNTIPFILFTGRGREEIVIQALNEGADFYLQKGGEPLSQFAELAHKIRLAVQGRQAEASIRDHERREADIINFLPDATFAIDTQGTVIAWNHAMEMMTGVPAAEMLGKGNYEYSIPLYHERRPILVDLILHEDPAIAAKYPSMRLEGRTLVAEATSPFLYQGRGATIWFTAAPLFNNKGEVVGAIESIRDISERKRTESALRENEERLSSIFAAAQVGIVIIDAESHRILQINQKALDMIGAREPEIIGNVCHTFICPAEKQKCPVTDLRQEVDSSERILIASDKRHVPIIKTVVQRQIGGRNVLVESFVDITDRKKAEDRLRFSEGKFAAAFDANPDPMAITDLKTGELKDINQSFEQWSGYSRDMIIGKSTRELDLWVYPEEREAIITVLNAQGEVHKKDVTHRIKSGEIRNCSFSAKVFEIGESRFMLSVAEDITERKAAEVALHRAHGRLRRFIDANIIGIIIATPSGAVIDTNDYYLRLIGYSREEFDQGLVDWKAITPPEWLPADEHAIEELRSRGECTPYEKQYIRRDGSRVWVLLSDALLPGPEENIVAFVMDITGRKLLDASLHRSEEQYRLINDSSRDFIYSYDRAGRFTSANHSLCEALNRSADQIMGKTHAELGFPENQCREWDELHRRVYATDATVMSETAASMPDGRTYTFEVVLNPMHDPDGTITGISGTTRDITDRKRAEEALKDSENLYRTIFESTGAATIIVESDTTIIKANEEFARLSGFSRVELEGKKSWTEFVVPADLERMKQYHYDRRNNPSGETRVYEFGYLTREGKIRHCINNVRTIPGTTRSIASVVDITDRKQAEKALTKSEEKYRTVLENIQDVFYRCDQDGRLIMASPSWAALLGYETVDECLGLKIAEKFYREPEARQVFLRAVQERGRVDNYEVTLKRKDGSPVQVSTNSHLYYDENGSVAGVEGIFRDITLLRKAQEETAQKSRILSIQNTIITAANRAQNLPELLEVCLDSTLRLLDYEAGGIYLVDNAAGTASVVHARNLPEPFLTKIRTVPIDRKPFDSLFVRGEPLITDHYQTLSPASAESGFTSLASVPLVAGTRIIGALNVASTRRNTVTEDERTLLLAIGQELGTAISRMDAEKLQKRAHDEWERTFNAVPDLISILDPSHRILRMNRAMAETLGVSPEQAVGLTCYESVHSSKKPPEFCPHSQVLRDQKEHTTEVFEERLGGYFLVSCTPLKDEDGRLLGSVHVARDITELKEKENSLLQNAEELHAANEQIAAAEEELRANLDELSRQELALRESKKELEDIINFLPDPTFAIDRTGRVIAWNLAIERMTGVHAEEMIGKGNYEYALPFYGERRPVLIDLIFKNEAELRNYTTVSRDGTTLIAETSLARLNGKELVLWGKATPLYNPGGEIIGAIESIRDFTDRRRLEDSLHQMNRKLKLLSSITRHDIVNNISACKGYLALAKQKSSDSQITKFIAGLEESIGSIQAQLEFSQIYQDLGGAAPVWQDLGEMLGKCSAAKEIPVQSAISNIAVFADPLISRVFYNLHDNTVRHGEHATAIHVRAEQRGEDMVIVWEDNGIGVLPGEKEKIFAWGFGKNTGHGLFLVREILAITGITIKETGEPGCGARFEITVPKENFRFTPE